MTTTIERFLNLTRLLGGFKTEALHHDNVPASDAKFKMGDRVSKIKGSSWTGIVVGSYSTSLTPEGYAVESENEPGSVQIYPAAALQSAPIMIREKYDHADDALYLMGAKDE